MVITIAGGGSTFTAGIVKSIALRREELEVDEIRLFDINKERQDKVAVLVDWVLHKELNTDIKLVVTTDVQQAYTDTSFVFAQMRVGGYAMREQDEKIPLRHGCVGQETCGCGGMAINATAMDTRIKATAAMTMYDMTRVNANGYFDSENTADARYAKKQAMNAQRTADYKNGTYALAGGVVDPLPEDAPQFVKDYYGYYKTQRGYHPRSLNSNGGWNVTSSLSFMNMPILRYAGEIRSAVLLVHGEKAHSRYFSEGAYEKLTGDNKELMIIPGANHVDLYDNLAAIPFEKLRSFFEEYLK